MKNLPGLGDHEILSTQGPSAWTSRWLSSLCSWCMRVTDGQGWSSATGTVLGTDWTPTTWFDGWETWGEK